MNVPHIIAFAAICAITIDQMHASHIDFIPINNDRIEQVNETHASRRNLIRSQRNIHPTPSQYGYFQISYRPPLCMDIPGLAIQNEKRLQFKRCKPGKESQIWRIDDNCYDYDELEGYEMCGKVHSYKDDNKCLQVRKGLGHRARLYMYDCKEDRSNQIWVYDSDCLRPRGDLDMTAYSWRYEGPKGGDPVILQECGGNSLDFNDFEA